MKQVCQKKETSTLPISLGRNSQVDELASGAVFPEPEFQLGMMLRMNGCEEASSLGKVCRPTQSVLIDQSQLITLEDRLKVMEKRNGALIAEKQSLQMQLTVASDKVQDLEMKYSSLLKKEQQKEAAESQKGASTLNLLETTERGSQAWAVCRACERKLEGHEGVEATVIITKSELESLERDMQTVRDALATRQIHWDERAIVKEQCYNEQLKRLAVDAMTARQLSDSRYAELERLAQTLWETESNLRSAKKEIERLKIIIAKKNEKGKKGKIHPTPAAWTTATNEKELSYWQSVNLAWKDIRRYDTANAKVYRVATLHQRDSKYSVPEPIVRAIGQTPTLQLRKASKNLEETANLPKIS